MELESNLDFLSHGAIRIIGPIKMQDHHRQTLRRWMKDASWNFFPMSLGGTRARNRKNELFTKVWDTQLS